MKDPHPGPLPRRERKEELYFYATVAHAHAEGHGFGSGVCETSFLQCLLHFVAFHECRNTLWQVSIGPAAISCDEGCSDGHDDAAVECVAPADWKETGLVEFEDDEAASRAEDAVELGDCFGRVGDITDTEGDRDDIERFIIKRQRHRVGLLEADPARRVSELCHCDIEHFLREVGADDSAGVGLCKCEGEVARAAGAVEDLVAVVDLGEPDRGFAPGLIPAEGMDAVVEVVRAGDCGEHVPHALGLVAPCVWILGQFLL